MKLLVAAVLSVALVATACGGGDSEDGTSNTEMPASSSVTPTSSVPSTAANGQQAEQQAEQQAGQQTEEEPDLPEANTTSLPPTSNRPTQPSNSLTTTTPPTAAPPSTTVPLSTPSPTTTNAAPPSAPPPTPPPTSTSSPSTTTTSPPSTTSPPTTTSPPSTTSPPPSTTQLPEFTVNLDTRPAEIYFQQKWCDDLAAKYPSAALTPTDDWCELWQDYAGNMVGCFRGNEEPEGSDPEFEQLVASGGLQRATRILDEIIFSLEDDDETDDTIGDQIADACSEEHFSQDNYDAMLVITPGTTRSAIFSYTYEMLLISVCAINSQLVDNPPITLELAKECGNPVSKNASCAGIAGAWMGADGEGDLYSVCLEIDDLISSDMEGWLEEAVRSAIQSLLSPEVTV